MAHSTKELSGQTLPDLEQPELRDVRDHQLPEVDVWFINIHAGSDFRMMHTGTTSVHKAITQVDKHVHRGLYSVVSMNATKHSCVVVFSTELSREELLWKNGFPWDIEEDPQPSITL
jgi:hypothetical protein